MQAVTLSNADPVAAPSAGAADAELPWAYWAAALILLFNLIDGLMTLAVVDAGVATEANPLMAISLAWGGAAFMLVKTTLVSLCVLLLYRRRERVLASAALVTLSAIYASIVVYHSHSLDALLRFLG
jgi:hypothetical protein